MLWFISRAVDDKGKISDRIKADILSLGIKVLDINPSAELLKYVAPETGQESNKAKSDVKLKRIKYIQARNFRGFGCWGDEDAGTCISFGPKKNIFYAPNGGGKTSLCEAVEFALTGTLKEAERRRSTVSDYTKRYNLQPTVKLVDIDDNLASQNPSWSTIFIDRNRLQEFSLLGSKDTKFAESDVLSALFGLEDIDALLERFVLPTSFDLKKYHLSKHHDKTDQLSRQLIVNRSDILSTRARIFSLEQSIARNLNLESYSFGDVKLRLNFKKNLLDRKIKSLEDAYLHELPATISLSRISAILKKIESDKRRLLATQQLILERSLEINYESLYEAILSIKNSHTSSNRCPACLTDLNSTTANPFERALSESEKLSEIPQLKKVALDESSTLKKDVLLLKSIFYSVSENNKKIEQEKHHLTVPQKILENINAYTEGRLREHIELIEAVAAWYAGNQQQIHSYAAICKKLYDNGLKSKDSYKSRQTKINVLRDEIRNILELEREISFHTTDNKNQSNAIKPLYNELCYHRKEKTREKEYNNLLNEVNEAYPALHKDFLNYKLNIEKTKINGIEAKSLEYYQAINKLSNEDPEVTSLYFERKKSGYRIKMDTAKQSNIDSIIYLSEGHLRSLGLSLLLATAEKNNHDLIIFDDVVNAIDSDHRANIIDLLYSDPYLSRIQQVITTHDRLFWERFCNKSSGTSDGDSFKSQVLTHSNEGIASIEYSASFYDKIEKSLELFDIRQALLYCRIWFESFATKYCRIKKLSVTVSFSERTANIPGNYLTISLEEMYRLIEKELIWDPTHINIIKKDLINWSGQNQVHHAFDEASYNFVHSKTSSEISRIFNALKDLETQLFPDEKLVILTSELADLQKLRSKCQGNLDNPMFVERGDPKIVKKYRLQLEVCNQKIILAESNIKTINAIFEKTKNASKEVAD